MFIYLVGFLTCESDLCRSRRSPLGVYPHPLYLRIVNFMSMPQAVRDVRASHSAIIDIFERMESFFFASRNLHRGTTDHWNDGYNDKDNRRGPFYSRDCHKGDQSVSNEWVPFVWLIILPLIELLYVQKNI
jgi:hypothetical protein